MTLRALLLSATVLAVAVSPAAAQTAPAARSAAPAAPMYGSFGFDTAGMDRSVDPGQSFFDFANGGWHAAAEIPADRSNWGAFAILAERAAARNHAIVQEAAAGQIEGEDARKVGDHFAAFMDEATIERLGVQPLQPVLSRIAAIDSRADLSREIGGTIRADVDAINATNTYTARPFGLWVAQNFDHPDQYAAHLMQGGLGMPDRAYYLEDGARFAQLREAYVQHVAAILTLAGMSDAERRAQGIMALETAIARSHWSAEQTGDMAAGNNAWLRADYATKAPGMDWNAFFQAAGLADQDIVKVWQPEAVTGMAALVGSESLEVWKDYLAFHAINRATGVLPKAFGDQSFAFYGRALSGAQVQSDRWKRGVASVNGALGDAMGRLYVARHFPPEAKAEVERMVENIKTAFDARIVALDWMSAETKAQARAKVAAMTVSVGYPNRWKDYSDLEIRRDDLFGNVERAGLHEYRRNLAKLGAPVDRGEWFMVPQTVNALNAPSQNGIQFPAAILEPPFFDLNADPAINYGAIGGVIGHEIVHGFDNSGALFSVSGKLENWWTPQDLARFNEAGQRLAAQYDGYEPLPGLRLNGQQTLGENIADVAGLAAALDGYRLSLGGQSAPVLDGTTGDQRVFLGWAQNWRAKYREAALRSRVLSGAHSPDRYRAETVRNIDDWYAAFDVKPGGDLYLTPEQRVRIW